MGEGRYGDAVTAFARARELDPRDAGLQRAWMRARAHLIADEPVHVRPENATELAYDTRWLIDHDTASKAVYLTALGSIHLRRGERAEARERFLEAIRLDGRLAAAHTALGVLLIEEPDGAARAREAFEQTLKLKPDVPVAHTSLGQILLREGKAQEAASHFEAALRSGDDAWSRVQLARAYRMLDRNDDAVAQLERAIAVEPRNAEAMRALGETLVAVERFGPAEGALRRALAAQPDVGTAATLGLALLRQGKAAEALAVFSQVLGQDGGSLRGLVGAGSAAEALGRKAEALGYFERALVAAGPDGGRDEGGDKLRAALRDQAAARIAALRGGKAGAPATPAGTR